ncbi:MAG TPA: septal ring lytic transglycosylase RlpA family protein [Solirubrobacterales bacterium]|nr:septal ring lytic transglycosylase RlpA family protein [Solirubrobacterales bacterium]
MRLSGTVPEATVSSVRIGFRRDGTHRWRDARAIETDETGAYSTRVKPPASGYFRAQPEGGQPSSEVPVRVRSVTKVRVKRHVVVGDRVKISGRVKPASAGRRVEIKLPGRDEKARTRSGGRFKERWKPRSTGNGKVRAIARGDRIAAGSRSRARKVTVYRPASASWYGPGFYGNRTACGQTLTPSTLGVANKSMPCGTKLTLRHGNRSVRVKVIDRGPFAGNREFDLTGATKNRLNFGSTGTVLSSR